MEQQNARSIAFYSIMLDGIELEVRTRLHEVATVLAPPVPPQQEGHQERSDQAQDANDYSL
jgi:hypothetical protein